MNASKLVIKLYDIKISVAGQWIHKGINLSVKPQEIVAIVGDSGVGKSTILREILLLLHPSSGHIELFGKNVKHLSKYEIVALKSRWGVLFQQSALFTSLTALENIAFPLYEYTQLDKKTITKLALLKLSAVGLPLSAATKYPSELSGGMLKRTALARALIMDPELLLLDEPTAGLDPQGADAFDKLILNLRDIFGLTILMVTHDLDTLWQISDKVAFLHDGTIVAFSPIRELIQSTNIAIRRYFKGPRGRITQQFYGESHGT